MAMTKTDEQPRLLWLNIAVFALALACAASMIFLVPRGGAVATEELIEQAEEEETGLL